MAECLVTGGAGFVGSHLVDALVGRGHRVRVLDNFSTGHRDNLAGVLADIELIAGDVTDLEAVRQVADGVEVIFHQAALASVPRSIADPVPTHHVNATGTLNVLLAAREMHVRRVIYAGSSSAYGNSAHLRKRETDAPQPLSPYAVSKLCGEEYCAVFSHVYGLETVRLRYFNVFGPRQPPGSPYSAVIPLFIEAMTAGRHPTIFGDGLQSRDFTFVDDVVQANLLAVEAPRVSGKAYNIACGRRTTLLELVSIINEILGTRIVPVHDKPRSGDVQHSQADITRAQIDLGYCPCTELKENLRQCIRHFQARPPVPTAAGGPAVLTSAPRQAAGNHDAPGVTPTTEATSSVSGSPRSPAALRVSAT